METKGAPPRDEDPETQEQAFQTTKHIETYESKGDVKSLPDSYLPKAFGSWSFEEIAKVLASKNKKTTLRDQGLEMLLQMCKRPTDIIRAVKADLVQLVGGNLDSPVALDCISQFARQRCSRTELLQKTQIVEALVDVASNGTVDCRAGAFQCLWELSQHPGMSRERKSKILELCIKSANDDKETQVKLGSLRVLKMMITRQDMAKEGNACVPVVTSLLDHKDQDVRMLSCEALQYACVSDLGKDSYEYEFYPLTYLRVVMIEAKTVPVLLVKLADEDAIKNYALQCLTNLFSHENIRHETKAVEANVKMIEGLIKSKDPIVAASAQSCLVP
eukprot:jgi/Bigna1/72252/fgenesh1_pg.19_\